MNGYIVVVKMSPVAITSDRRKKTMLSPSVWAAGWWKICTASPAKKTSLSSPKNVSVGHASGGTPGVAISRLSTVSCAMIVVFASTLPPSPAWIGAAFSLVGPAFASAALPPMASPRPFVLTM